MLSVHGTTVNWDAIGAIGEIIGAVAVVATLLYLAVQTRQLRSATLGDMYQRRAESRANRHDLIAFSHPQFHEIWIKFQAGIQTDGVVSAYEALEESEKLFIAQNMQANLTTMDFSYVQWKRGNIPDMKIDGIIKQVMKFHRLWAELELDYPSKEFADFVEDVTRQNT